MNAAADRPISRSGPQSEAGDEMFRPARRGRLPGPATDLDYLCARVRVRISELWPAIDLERMRRLPALAQLLPWFLEGDYRREAQSTLLDANDLEAWEAMLTAVFVRRMGRLCLFVEQSIPAYSCLFTGPWDLHHVRSLMRWVLRGGRPVEPGASPPKTEPDFRGDHAPLRERNRPWSLAEAPDSRGRPPAEPDDRGRDMQGPAAPATEEYDDRELLVAYVPIGRLTRDDYRRAAQSGSLAELCRRLEEQTPELVQAMRRFLRPSPEAAMSLAGLELCLEDCHLRQMLRCARRSARCTDRQIVSRYIGLLADTVNLRTSLCFLGRHVSPETVAALFVPRGRISPAQFASLMAADAIEQVYRQLPRGPLTAALDRGMPAWSEVGRISAFEAPMEQQQRLLLRQLARRMPVSVAVPMYYASRATDEWRNLILIARGIHYRLPAGKLQGKLIYV